MSPSRGHLPMKTQRVIRTGLGIVILCALYCAEGDPLLAAAGSNTRDGATLVALAAPQQEAGEAEHATGEHPEGESEEHSPLQEAFHWINFLLIVGGLGYLIKKMLVPFLDERRKLIREDMDRSAKALADADQRLATVEQKLKSMDAEMASLRQAAFRESAAERDRIEQAATAEAAKILATAEQEIESAVKTARQELKVYTSELALGLAEKKIRASLTPASDERILRAFVNDLTDGESHQDPSGRNPD